jgi:acyl carrier protein
MSREIPQGIEVLVLKAAIDPEFKQLLLERRIAAADSIGLELSPAEAAMLAAVPRQHLEAIVGQTTVPQEHRRAFLGQAAAAMVAALSVLGSGSAVSYGFGKGGMRADDPTPVPGIGIGGIQPDRPSEKPNQADNLEERVIGIVAKQLKADKDDVTRDKALVQDLQAKPADLVRLKKALEKEFGLKIPGEAFKKLRTVGQIIDYVRKAPDKKVKPERPAPAGTFGNRPDTPPGAFGGVRP